MRTTKELRGMAGAASVAGYRMYREIERKYTNDPVGMAYTKDLLNDMRTFIDDIALPLEEANDFDEACDLRGSNRMQLERINRTIGILQARKAELEQMDNFTSMARRKA